MPPDLTIRTATLQDRDALQSLWLAFLREQASLDSAVSVADDASERWRNDFPAWVERDRRHIVLAEVGREVVGFAAAVRWSPAPIFAYSRELYLEDFFVAPDHRRRGIGAALYAAVREWGASWDAERIRLSVLAENALARPFWRRMGLREMSVTMVEDLVSGRPGSTEEPTRRIGFEVLR